jgi:hypothetical protein
MHDISSRFARQPHGGLSHKVVGLFLMALQGGFEFSKERATQASLSNDHKAQRAHRATAKPIRLLKASNNLEAGRGLRAFPF